MELETLNVRFAEELVPGSRFYGGKSSPVYTVAQMDVRRSEVQVTTTDGEQLVYPSKKVLVVLI